MQELMSELQHTHKLITRNKELGKINFECEQRRRNLSKYANVKPRNSPSQRSPHSKYTCHGDDPQVKSHLTVSSKENNELGTMNSGKIQNIKNKQRFKMKKKSSKNIGVPSRYMQFYQQYKQRGAKSSPIRGQTRSVTPAQLDDQNQMSTQQLGFVTHQKSPFQHKITQTINNESVSKSKEERNFTVEVNDVQEMREKLKPIRKPVQNGNGLDQGSTSRFWTAQTDNSSVSNRRNRPHGDKLTLTSRTPKDQASDFRKVEFDLPNRIKKKKMLPVNKQTMLHNQVKPLENKQSFKKTIENVSRYNNNGHLGTPRKYIKNEVHEKSFGQKYTDKKSFDNKNSNKLIDKIKRSTGTPLMNKQQATKPFVKAPIEKLIMKNKMTCPARKNERITSKLKEGINLFKKQVQTPVKTNLIRSKFMECMKTKDQTGILESKLKKDKKKNTQVIQKQTIGVKKMSANKNKMENETDRKRTADNSRYKTNQRTFSQRFEQWCKMKHPELIMKLKTKKLNTRKNNDLKTYQKKNKVNNKLKHGVAKTVPKNTMNKKKKCSVKTEAKTVPKNSMNEKKKCTVKTEAKTIQEQIKTSKEKEKKQNALPNENLLRKYSLKRTKPAPCLNPEHLETPEKMSPLPSTYMNMMERYNEDVLKLNTIVGEVSIRIKDKV